MKIQGLAQDLCSLLTCIKPNLFTSFCLYFTVRCTQAFFSLCVCGNWDLDLWIPSLCAPVNVSSWCFLTVARKHEKDLQLKLQNSIFFVILCNLGCVCVCTARAWPGLMLAWLTQPLGIHRWVQWSISALVFQKRRQKARGRCGRRIKTISHTHTHTACNNAYTGYLLLCVYGGASQPSLWSVTLRCRL